MQSPMMHKSPEKMFAISVRLFLELIRIAQVLKVPYDSADCTIGQNDRLSILYHAASSSVTSSWLPAPFRAHTVK